MSRPDRLPPGISAPTQLLAAGCLIGVLLRHRWRGELDQRVADYLELVGRSTYDGCSRVR